MLPTYEELIKKMAQEIRLVNLDYLVGTLNPQETLSGSRDLAQAALQGLLENLPLYEIIRQSGSLGLLANKNAEFYEQLLAMRKNDKRG